MHFDGQRRGRQNRDGRKLGGINIQRQVNVASNVSRIFMGCSSGMLTVKEVSGHWHGAAWVDPSHIDNCSAS